MEAPVEQQIVIMGMPGAGKSTLALRLASTLHRDVWDSDEAIERRVGMTSGRFAQVNGVDRLHALEVSLFLESLNGPPRILTPAASVVDSPEARAACRAHFVVWLDAPVEVLTARHHPDAPRRSMSEAELDRLSRQRRGRFAQVADLTLDAADTPERLAAGVVRAWEAS